MEAVCYKHAPSGIIPVGKYLDSFDQKKDEGIFIKILTAIDQVIRMDGVPCLPLSRKVINYSFCEIRIKKGGKKLIRMPYFCHNHQKIVLLYVFEKPEGDYKGKEERKIIKEYDIAEEYYQKFIINPNSYEEYKNYEN